VRFSALSGKACSYQKRIGNLSPDAILYIIYADTFIGIFQAINDKWPSKMQFLIGIPVYSLARIEEMTWGIDMRAAVV